MRIRLLSYVGWVNKNVTQYLKAKNILNMCTDCGFSLPLPAGEGWGEGFQKKRKS